MCACVCVCVCVVFSDYFLEPMREVFTIPHHLFFKSPFLEGHFLLTSKHGCLLRFQGFFFYSGVLQLLLFPTNPTFPL